MLRTLLAKDLRRTWRNPVPWLVSLAVPLVITALVGGVFGPGGGGGLGRITVAFVDEDETALTEFLRGALEQMRTENARERPPFTLEAQFLARDEAMRRLTEDEIAAAVVLPQGFTDGFLGGGQPVVIELVKNPARAIQPRVVEEALGLLVTVLNSATLLAGEQLVQVRALVASDDDFFSRAAAVGSLLADARARLEPVKAYLAPPLVGYTTEAGAVTAAATPGASVFSFVLAGMSAMFLLIVADAAMRDLYRESRAHTLERFRTLRSDLFRFVAGKAVFSIVSTLIAATILLGGGALIFRFAWRQPGAVVLLALAYALCAAGLTGLLAGLAGAERRADVMGNIVIMGLALAGGCMFPPEMFPPFLREFLTPLLPTNWFAVALRELQSGNTSGMWLVAAAKLAVLGLATLVGATFLFRRRLERGGRP